MNESINFHFSSLLENTKEEATISSIKILTNEGWILILPNHQPICGEIKESKGAALFENGNVKEFFVNNGIFFFNENEINIFADHFSYIESYFEKNENEKKEIMKNFITKYGNMLESDIVKKITPLV